MERVDVVIHRHFADRLTAKSNAVFPDFPVQSQIIQQITARRSAAGHFDGDSGFPRELLANMGSVIQREFEQMRAKYDADLFVNQQCKVLPFVV